MAVPVPEGTETVATRFSAAGYRTANIGKLHFRPHSNRDHREAHAPYGFDHLEISDEPGPYDDAYRAFVRRVAPQWLDRMALDVDPPMARQWRETLKHEDGIVHPTSWSPWTTRPPQVPDDLTHTAFVGRRVSDFVRGQPRRLAPSSASRASTRRTRRWSPRSASWTSTTPCRSRCFRGRPQRPTRPMRPTSARRCTATTR